MNWRAREEKRLKDLGKRGELGEERQWLFNEGFNVVHQFDHTRPISPERELERKKKKKHNKQTNTQLDSPLSSLSSVRGNKVILIHMQITDLTAKAHLTPLDFSEVQREFRY